MHMIHKRQLCCGVFLLLLTVGASTEVFDSFGCRAFKVTEDKCFVEGVEALPSLHISEGGIHLGLLTAEECQKRCQEFADCHYFTFRQKKDDQSTTCHLKPALSVATSPVMVVRTYPATSLYTYISGPVDCSTPCQEEKELVTDCGGSTPGSCEAISGGDAKFDAACSTKDLPGCYYKGYRCCVDCSEGKCCTQSKEGKLLLGGTSVGAYPLGILSSAHCHGLCNRAVDCTHWSYISSLSSPFVGGACYLKTYTPVTDPQIGDAPADTVAVVGSVDCKRDYGLHNKVHQQDCRETNVDFGNVLSTWYNAKDADACQKLCQSYPGCRYYVLKWTHCSLKWSNEGKQSSHEATVAGAAYCDGTEKPWGCLLPGLTLEGNQISSQYASSADICSRMCGGNSQCAGWSFSGVSCRMLEQISGRKPDPTTSVISALRECTLNDPNEGEQPRRALELVDTAVPERCIYNNKSFKGYKLTSLRNPTPTTLDDCYRHCVKTPHCNMISTAANGSVCDLYTAGTLTNVRGVLSVHRGCPEETVCQGTHCAAGPQGP